MGGRAKGQRSGAMTRIAPATRARARLLRRDMTPQERLLWMQLRNLNRMYGTHFRRQAPVGPFIADFCEFGQRLVIEADGGGHGGARDQARDAWFAAQGFAVLRVWNSDIQGNIEGVMQRVLGILCLRDAPPPQPSPTRGEGAPVLPPSSHATPFGDRAGRPPYDRIGETP